MLVFVMISVQKVIMEKVQYVGAIVHLDGQIMVAPNQPRTGEEVAIHGNLEMDLMMMECLLDVEETTVVVKNTV